MASRNASTLVSGADAHEVVFDLDAAQVVASRQEADRPEIAQALRHPEPHIGRPGDQCCLRSVGVERREFVGRYGAKPAAVSPRTTAVVRRRPRERIAPSPVACRQVDGTRSARRWGGPVVRHGVADPVEPGPVVHPFGDGRLRGGVRGADYGRVARASAERPRQLILVVTSPVQVRGGERGHDAGRAEAALRAVMLDHRRLDRMQGAVGGREAFDRSHGLAVKLWQEEDAGVQGTRALAIGHDHRAGTAIAFVAAFLGSGQAAFLAQPVQQRPRRRYLVQRHGITVQQKRDHDNPAPPYQVFVWPSLSMRRRTRGPQFRSRSEPVLRNDASRVMGRERAT